MDREINIQLLQIAASLIVPNATDSAETLEKNYRKVVELFKENDKEE